MRPATCLSDQIGPNVDVGSCREVTGGPGRKGLEISFARPLRGPGSARSRKRCRAPGGPTLRPGLCRLASGNGRSWGAGLSLLPRATIDEGLRAVSFHARAHMCLPNYLMVGGNSYRPWVILAKRALVEEGCLVVVGLGALVLTSSANVGADIKSGAAGAVRLRCCGGGWDERSGIGTRGHEALGRVWQRRS